MSTGNSKNQFWAVFAFAVFLSCWAEPGARTWDQLLPLPLSCHSRDGAGCHRDAPRQPCDCPWQSCGSNAELKLLFCISENTALGQTGGTETIYMFTINQFYSPCCMQAVFHGTLKAGWHSHGDTDIPRLQSLHCIGSESCYFCCWLMLYV